MPRVTFDVHTALKPEQVLSMLTDFSSLRPKLWPTLARELYEVYEAHPTSADVKEGGPLPTRMWERVRYDWSVPGRVRWTVLDSNYFAPGSFTEVTVRPSEDDGSVVHVESNRRGVRLGAKILTGLIALTRGAILRRTVFRPAFDRQLKKQLASRHPHP